MSVRITHLNRGKCQRCRRKKPSYILDVPTYTESDLCQDQYEYMYLCRACKKLELEDELVFEVIYIKTGERTVPRDSCPGFPSRYEPKKFYTKGELMRKLNSDYYYLIKA